MVLYKIGANTSRYKQISADIGRYWQVPENICRQEHTSRCYPHILGARQSGPFEETCVTPHHACACPNIAAVGAVDGEFDFEVNVAGPWGFRLSPEVQTEF